MEFLLTYLPLIVVFYGFVHYTIKQMKKFGTIFILLNYFKWFIGVSITFFAFYVIHLAGNLLKENDLSIVFSLPIGIFVWFVPMNYLSKIFQDLEDKFKKQPIE
ncbi:MAG: hypothetical protein U9P72_08550 [Campylobacterota bacterium]|nr:hypothetical protein [Campylobacterota bacterium]